MCSNRLIFQAPLTRRSRRVVMIAAMAAVTLVLFSLLSIAHAQPAQPGQLPAMDAATRTAVVDSITAAIDSIYVLEEPAKRIVAGLKKNLADGKYDKLTDPAELAQRLHEDAQAINHDGHFRIFALPPLDPAVAEAERDEDPADVERRRRWYKTLNYGFKKVEILPGGIGYLRFDQFSHGDDAFEAAAASMNFLANTNAVILDLRNNGGGSAAMIRFICGYFFEDDTHLINWDIRAENKTVQSYSADYVPGKRLLEQPVYVLTSGNTFSAAEEFTFDLKNLERAIVVGDTTGGGGHTVAGYTFDFDGFRMGIRLPYGRAYNPENNEGWEGVGVVPDIPVSSDIALETAQIDALGKLIEKEEDEEFKSRLQWARLDLESRLNPIEMSRNEMEMYVGSYGPRRVYVEDGSLYYQREGRSPYKLEPMGDHLFRVGDLDYFRLTFDMDKSRAVKVIGLYSSGRRDENKRDDG
ncbi:MAG: S41 family peptidase [Candidatus Latescibacterota bacterium]|nr:MAG: S41 family peptidase [Candidatus Latescibacterota bacterium]